MRFRSTPALLVSLGFFLAVACQKEADTPPDTAAANGLLALPTAVPAPADNPTTPAKAALGKLLFWDPILSATGDVSCASCHHPASGYADALDLAVGVNGQGHGASRHFRLPNDIPFGKRNTPTVLNAAFNGLDAAGTCNPTTATMFWDGRAQSLETQSVLPIGTLEEMRGRQCAETAALDSAVARVVRVAEYRQLFSSVFGSANAVTAANLARALACFERTLVTPDSPFDRYQRGDKSAMSAQQIQGLDAFIQSGCAKCHSGPMFSDYKLHVLGLPDNAKLAASDGGAGGTYAFRTPSLRNVAATAPYMHNGTLPNLDAVLRFYAPRGRPLNPNVPADHLDPLLPRTVTDPQAIVAFLAALSSEAYDHAEPARVPSGLAVGGNVQ